MCIPVLRVAGPPLVFVYLYLLFGYFCLFHRALISGCLYYLVSIVLSGHLSLTITWGRRRLLRVSLKSTADRKKALPEALG